VELTAMRLAASAYSALVLLLSPVAYLLAALVLAVAAGLRALHDAVFALSCGACAFGVEDGERTHGEPNSPENASRSYTAGLWTVSGIPTEVLEWEPQQGETSPFEDLIMLVFPGNPGAPQFYSSFCDEVFERSGRRLRVIVTGHAAHSAPAAAGLSGPRYLYDLQQQVGHKRNVAQAVLRRHPGAQLVLVGHSIGAHCVLECARSLPPAALAAGLLLFPTVMHIGDTRNGRKLTPVFQWLRGAAWLGAAGLAILPAPARRAVVGWLIPEARLAENGATRAAALSLLHPQVVVNALHMALAEMLEVRELRLAGLQEGSGDGEPGEEQAGTPLPAFQSRLVWYYAAEDHWVEEEHIRSVRALLPASAVHRCQEGHRHAFVLSEAASRSVGAKCWMWITQHAGGSKSALAASLSPVLAGAAAGPAASRGRGRSGSRSRHSLKEENAAPFQPLHRQGQRGRASSVTKKAREQSH